MPVKAAAAGVGPDVEARTEAKAVRRSLLGALLRAAPVKYPVLRYKKISGAALSVCLSQAWSDSRHERGMGGASYSLGGVDGAEAKGRPDLVPARISVGDGGKDMPSWWMSAALAAFAAAVLIERGGDAGADADADTRDRLEDVSAIVVGTLGVQVLPDSIGLVSILEDRANVDNGRKLVCCGQTRGTERERTAQRVGGGRSGKDTVKVSATGDARAESKEYSARDTLRAMQPKVMRPRLRKDPCACERASVQACDG